MKSHLAGLKGLFLILIITGFSSCVSTSTYRFGRTTSFYPDQVKFELQTSDFELVGEMDISVKYSQYLHFIKIFELINDQEVSKRHLNTMALYGKANIPLPYSLYRALYDVYVKYPDADFTVPTFVIAEEEKLFLGRKVKQTARIKVYKLKI